MSDFLKKPGVVTFEPMPGRIMTGYASITDPLHWKRDELGEWIANSLAFVDQLPMKTKRSVKSKRR